MPHVKVETTPLTYATVHIGRRAGGARLGIHGGGFIVDRLINERTIARRVATALRTSSTLAIPPPKPPEADRAAADRQERFVGGFTTLTRP
jgi:hypothetical protein